MRALPLLTLLLAALSWGGGRAQGPGTLVEVQAQGRAPLELPQARAVALSEALRAAVAQGAGVDVLSETRVTDLSTDYDRIFQRSFGYVRSYRILESAEQDGHHVVRIAATVGAGRPETEDRLALLQILRSKGSPTLRLGLRETLNGSAWPEGPATRWIRQRAVDLGMSVVDAARSESAATERARRDDFHGDETVARLRNAQLQEVGEYEILGTLDVRTLETVETFGLRQIRFSVHGQLQLLQAGREQILVQVEIPPTRVLSAQSTTEDAAREAVAKLLEGDLETSRPGRAFFGKLLTLWITDLDLGKWITLESIGLTREQYDRWIAGLRKTEGITSVRPLEFDQRGFARLDVESRLDAGSLSQVSLSLLGPAWKVVRQTPSFVDLRPDEDADSGTSKRRLPPWAVRGAALALALLGGGAVLVGLRKTRTP